MFILANMWPVVISILLLAGLGPPLLRWRGTQAVLLFAIALWLLAAFLLRLMHLEFHRLGYLAVWLGVVAAAVLVLGKLRWPVIAQSLVAIVLGVVLPPAIWILAFWLSPP